MIRSLFSRTACRIKPLRTIKSMRVTKVNTLLRVVYTVGLSLILSGAAFAQTVAIPPASVLNFVEATVNDRSNASFSVTNPTSNYADVTFTFYGLDGNPVSSGLNLNPVRHRVAPKGQISVRAGDLFAASNADGWVQVTSPTAGLAGFYLLGDFAAKFEGAESASTAFPRIRSAPWRATRKQLHSSACGRSPGRWRTSITSP